MLLPLTDSIPPAARRVARSLRVPLIVLLATGLTWVGVVLARPADASVSAAADLTAGVNGVVYDTAHVNGRSFLVGSFTWAGPRTGSGVPVDPATGVRTSIPRINGPVHAAAADGNNGWYVGGEFVFAGGRTRNNVARVSGVGNVTNWDASVNGPVRAIAVSAGVVYLGGSFSTVGGQARNNIAAVSADTGALLAWNPGVGGTVDALAVSADGAMVYAAGAFGVRAYDAATGTAVQQWGSALGGAFSALAVSGSRLYAGGDTGLSAVDAATGSTTAWSVATDAPVRAVAVGAGAIYLGGVFSTVAGSARARLAALAPDTGAVTPWNPDANGAVNSLQVAADGATVYAGGEFTVLGGQPRNRTGAVLAADGAPTGWHPSAEAAVSALAVSGARVLVGGAFTMLNGLPRRNAAALDAAGEVDPAWDPSPDDITYAIEPAADGSLLFLGGNFLNLGTAARSRLAAVNLSNGQPLARAAWPTGANGVVRALKVSGQRLYVGGNFTRAAGLDTGRLVALNTADGAVDTGFTPRPSATVRALAVSPDGSKLYATGSFTTIAGGSRPGAAELVAATGTLTSFAPSTGGVVIAVALTPDGSRLFYSTTSNRTHAYDPALSNTPAYTIRTGGDVQAIAVSATEVYIGGHFTTLPQEKLNRLHAASFLVSDGTPTPWAPRPDGEFGVWCFEITPSALLMGGDFAKVGGAFQPGFARFAGTA
ncbi:MAG TPA: hypothetical protein VFR67_10260 [Pilimelia sp.]|nr:hypothetical protein [Pilimelia sp.]